MKLNQSLQSAEMLMWAQTELRLVRSGRVWERRDRKTEKEKGWWAASCPGQVGHKEDGGTRGMGKQGGQH